VRQLHNYGAREVLGIRYGYRGLNPASGLDPVLLTEQVVDEIHRDGGTLLASSRGGQDTATMVDTLERLDVQILFCVGGDGTQRGAHDIAVEAQRRGTRLAVVGIPKTIDNDIPFISRSFGFVTAIEEARKAIDSAHTEAKGAPNGIGLVKVMGRDAGFIAAGATIASQDVNFTLIPEAPFDLDGPSGLLSLLEQRLARKQHAVIVVAEGAGQDLIPGESTARDRSGNVKHDDIGPFLAGRIKEYFAGRDIEINLKYIDPSYIIRSVPANCTDGLLCDRLARQAVHAGMAGKTDVLIGLWHGTFIHVPVRLAVARKKRVDPESELWISVHETTGQPLQFRAPA
jgi:6-phosphofructokinase 1